MGRTAKNNIGKEENFFGKKVLSKNNKGNDGTGRETAGFSSRKGMEGYFIILSIIGILIGIWLIMQGLGGKGLSSGIVLFLGIFMVIKETLDMFH